MGPTITAFFARQHGLITFRQARQAGLHVEQVRRLVRSGAWVKVRTGVYADAEVWNALDARRGRPLLRIRAAEMVLTVPHWYSHDWAAVIHGMGLLDRGTDVVHLTRPDMRGRRAKGGITQHGAKVRDKDITSIDGLPAVWPGPRETSSASTASPWGWGLATIALRSGVTRAELPEVSEWMRNWPFSTLVREAVSLADAGAANAGESGSRALVLELGIGRPQTQFGLTDGTRTVWCDMRVGRHMFEFDGRLEDIETADGGLAQDPVHVLRKEKKRQDFVCGFKLGMSRITMPTSVRTATRPASGWRASTTTPWPGSAPRSTTWRRTLFGA